MSEESPKLPTSTKDFRVLVVDDEPEIAKSVAQLVAGKGFRAAMTTSGEAAIRQFDNHDFDLVLLDLAMPEMNGWQVLEELKKKAKPPQVVIMTGYVPQEGESILFDRKADGYLIKPIEGSRIETMLRALLFPQNLGRHLEAVVIDDDPSIVKAIETALTIRGIHVTPFNDGESAVQHIRQTTPDVVVTDLNLPAMDGFGICRRIRSDSDTAGVPIIILTGDPSAENVKQALGLAVNGFLAKPFDAPSLIAKVFQVLGPKSPKS